MVSNQITYSHQLVFTNRFQYKHILVQVMLLADLQTKYQFTTTKVVCSLCVNVRNGIQVIYVVISLYNR